MEQTILVTGSSSGFGRLTVETLARQGYIVFAGMRAAAGKTAPAAEEIRALAQRERLALHSIEIDVTDDASVERAIAVMIETTGRLDVVVNNAGVSYSGPLEAFTLEQVRQQFEINVFSVLRVNRAVHPQDAEDIDLELLADLFKGEGFQRTTVGHPGVVDHHIKTTGRLDHHGDGPLHGGVIRDIDLDDLQGQRFSLREHAECFSGSGILFGCCTHVRAP